MKLSKKIITAFIVAGVAALLATISVSPPAMAARQALFNAAANNAALYIVCVAIIGFLGSLYLTHKIDD